MGCINLDSLEYILLHDFLTCFAFWGTIIKGQISDLRQRLTTESLLKMMENAFYFMLKALFVLEIFILLTWLFGYVEKRFDKKVNFKFLTSQTGQQIIKIHILYNKT